MLCEAGSHYTTEGFNTHKTETREVRYGWHPWQGRQVAVRGVRTRSGLKVLSCTLDDDRGFPVLEIPEWMFDAVVCDRLERAEAARVDIGALRGLRVLLDSIKPTAKEVVLEDQHHSRVQRGADAKKIEVKTVRAVPGGSAGPGGPPRSPSEMIRLLARLLREYVARKGDRHYRLEANHE
jgi:hypothetical protein